MPRDRQPEPTVVDATGTLCPVPVLLARRTLAALPTGAAVEVVGDDPAMRIDLPAFCDTEGHTLLALDTRDGLVRCLLTKGRGP